MNVLSGALSGLLAIIAVQLSIELGAGRIPIPDSAHWIIGIGTAILIEVAFIFSGYEQERGCAKDRTRVEGERDRAVAQRDEAWARLELRTEQALAARGLTERMLAHTQSEGRRR